MTGRICRHPLRFVPHMLGWLACDICGADFRHRDDCPGLGTVGCAEQCMNTTDPAAQQLYRLEADFVLPAYWRCAHCGQPITGTGHTWTGPALEPGQSTWDQRRYHLSLQYPDCRRAADSLGPADTTTDPG